MKLHKKILFLFLALFLFIPIISFANNTIIHVAILDNIEDQSLPNNYKHSYIQGLQVAALAAQVQGFTVQYKTFFYTNQPLAILKEVPLVQAWKPDVIIGPHSSNQFLLLKSSFGNTLVISPYASDPQIANMPANFYSLSSSDVSIDKALTKFISSNFNQKNIFNVVAGDCKDCVDATLLFSNMYKKNNPLREINEGIYLENVSEVNIGKLMNNYKKDDLIVLQSSTYEEAQQLIYRISSYFNTSELTFITNLDNWGSFGCGLVPNDNYNEYWITPYLFDKRSENYQTFLKYYSQKYNYRPRDGISYTSFLTVMSVVGALTHYPYHQTKSMRNNILNNYLLAIKQNPNWFKATLNAIYKINANGIQMIKTIPVIND